MYREAYTSPQFSYDPWLLAARNASRLGFTYSEPKNGLAKYIQPYMPPRGGIYCEPFAGLAALYWKMALTADYEQWRLNDIRTAPFLRAFLTRGNALEVPARSHEEFARQKASFALGDTAAILLGLYFSFNGGFYDKGERQDKGSITAPSYDARLRMSHAIMSLTQPEVTAFDWSMEDSLARLRLHLLAYG
jgi:hypothetical protein